MMCVQSRNFKIQLFDHGELIISQFAGQMCKTKLPTETFCLLVLLGLPIIRNPMFHAHFQVFLIGEYEEKMTQKPPYNYSGSFGTSNF